MLAVGAGSIGDIYRPTERGRAIGVFYAGVLIGPAIAPVVAGIMTEFVLANPRIIYLMKLTLSFIGILMVAGVAGVPFNTFSPA